MANKVMKRENKYIPKELVIDILTRTSWKDLGRCNCVSKEWRGSVTVSALIQRHINSSDIDTNGGMVTVLYQPPCHSILDPLELVTFKIPNNNNNNNNNNEKRTSRIVEGKLKRMPSMLTKYDTCSNIYHGLICFYNQWLYTPSDLSMLLYSTTTNEGVVLNFDNSSNLGKMRQYCYIGFDTLRNEYKIVRMVRYYKGCEDTYYETLVLGSESWIRVDKSKVPLSLSQGWGGHSFCLDGVIFWIHNYATNYTVAAFDLNREEFRTFDLYEILRDCFFGKRPEMCYIAALRGCPTVFVVPSKKDREQMLVCTFSDPKMTSVKVTSKSIAERWSSLPNISVYPSKFVVTDRCLKTYHKSLFFFCKDLESRLNWDIQVRQTS